jgi:hypothetical protein
MAMDWEMKVMLVLVIVLLAAATATAFAYGGSHVAASMSAVVAETADVTVGEPAKLLLSGSLLIGLASVMRRLPL